MKYSLYKHASHIWVNTKEEASSMLFVLSHFTLQPWCWKDKENHRNPWSEYQGLKLKLRPP